MWASASYSFQAAFVECMIPGSHAYRRWCLTAPSAIMRRNQMVEKNWRDGKKKRKNNSHKRENHFSQTSWQSTVAAHAVDFTRQHHSLLRWKLDKVKSNLFPCDIFVFTARSCYFKENGMGSVQSKSFRSVSKIRQRPRECCSETSLECNGVSFVAARVT